MRWSALLGVTVCVVAATSRAGATSDSGTSARLLALAGSDHQFAVIVEDNVQEPCGGLLPCKAYYVDITSGLAKRLAAQELPANTSSPPKTNAGVLAQYLRTLPAAYRAKLTGATLAGAARRGLPYNATQSTGASVRFELGAGDGLNVQIERVWRTPSIAPWDKLSSESCLESGTAQCSTCARATRWYHGERFVTWACAGIGRIAQGGRQVPCDCAAEAELVRLQVTRQKTGSSFEGSAVFVDPSALDQNWMNGPGTAPSVGVGFVAVQDDAGLAAYEVDAGVIIVGSVAHQWSLNGTFFPVFAVVPRSALPPRRPAAPAPPATS